MFRFHIGGNANFRFGVGSLVSGNTNFRVLHTDLLVSPMRSSGVAVEYRLKRTHSFFFFLNQVFIFNIFIFSTYLHLNVSLSKTTSILSGHHTQSLLMLIHIYVLETMFLSHDSVDRK